MKVNGNQFILFKNGDLDDVMKHKSEEDSAMTEKSIKHTMRRL